MYIRMTDKLVNIHRHVSIIGKRLSNQEINSVREQLRLADDKDLVPNGTLAGYPIKSVNVNHKAGKETTTVVLVIKDEETV